MTSEEPMTDSFDMSSDVPSTRRRVFGCCAIIIIVIFMVALIVGYSSWFVPFIP